jgi:hypothetical protein
MRNLVAVSMLCLLLPVTIHAQAKTDRERDGLKGSVQSVKVRRMTIVTEDEKRTETLLLLSHAISYDRAGRRSELALYDKGGILRTRIAYSYDPLTNRRSELATYDANNIMVRNVIDTYGNNGFKSSQAIYDYNDDKTLNRKTVLTFDPLGELTEVAEFRQDGSLIKKESAPFKERKYSYSSPRKSQGSSEDPVVGYGSGGGEYFERDVQGNWKRGITSSTSLSYSSGKKVKTEEIEYREFTYYQ